MAFKYNPFSGELDISGGGGGGGGGDVTGPASSTDDAIVRYDGTTGKIIKNSSSTLSDSNVLSTGELNLTTDLEVEYGGTGRSSSTAYSVVCGGTTSTNPLQSVVSVGTSGQILTSNGPGALPTFQTGGAGAGDVVGPASSTDDAITRFDGVTGKLVQNSTSTLTDAGVLTTAELNLTTDLAVTHGGTGRSSATEYSVLCGGTTTTGAHQSVASVGTSGQVLTSNGAGSLPTFQVASGDVNGPVSSTDNAMVRWDGTGGDTLQDSDIIVDDADAITGVTQLTVDYTATGSGPNVVEVNVDADGNGDVCGNHLTYDTGVLTAGSEENATQVTVNKTDSTGGSVAGITVNTTSGGSATVYGLKAASNVNPVFQSTGISGDFTEVLVNAVDETTDLSSGGAGNVDVFVANNDTMTFGSTSKFSEIQIALDPLNLAIPSIAPTFEYSTGGSGFSSFTPTDGTSGMTSDGSITWDPSTIPLWATNTSGNYEIRIERTESFVFILPIMDLAQVASGTEYTWDSDGDVSIKGLTLVDELTVANGGTGKVSFTEYSVVCGGTTGGGALQSVTSVGTSGQVLTSNGAGSLPTFQAASSSGVITITALDDTDSPYTVLSSDYYMSCDTTSGVLTVDLPDAPTTGTVYIVKDSAGTADTNNITVSTAGAETIDGSATYVMNTEYEAANFVYTGSGWEVF